MHIQLKSMPQLFYKPFKYTGAAFKKYSVYVKGANGKRRLIHFGDSRYEQYFDKLRSYRHMDHKNLRRRAAYRARHAAIKLKDGSLAYKDRAQPSYYSMKYLW
jgi:hypothetical protein